MNGMRSKVARSSKIAAPVTRNGTIINSQGKTVNPLEPRNHPKTGDPMRVDDGDAYVTAYQRRPDNASQSFDEEWSGF